MTVIPNFIIKKLYVSGSLRNQTDGVAFDIHNTLGPGILSHINSIKLDGEVYPSNQIVFIVDDKAIPGDQISDSTPMHLMLHQKATCIIKGATASEGKHTLTMDLISKEAGKIVISIQDQLAA